MVVSGEWVQECTRVGLHTFSESLVWESPYLLRIDTNLIF